MTKRRKRRETDERDERRRADERLQAILEGTAAKIGSAFFRSLVQHLAIALDVKNVFVGEVEPADPQRVQSLAVWSGDGFGENFEYSIIDTPCEAVVSQAVCFYGKHVQQSFPRDETLAEIGAQSYLGIPLVGSSGKSLGLLVAMDDRPMVEDPRDVDLLRIFAVRAGAEIERQRAEAALAASEHRSRLIIETTRDAVITIDSGSLVTGWNTRAEETFGWSKVEAVGRDLAELIIPPELREAHRAGLLHFLETGKGPLLSRRVEIEGLHKSGSRLPLELAIATLHSGDAYEFSAFVQDISERKRAEAEKRRLESQVQYAQKLESLGVLAGGIAHDFNNLLTGILANAAFAQRDLPAEHPIQPLLGEVVQSSKLAAQLTGQLLDYAGRGQIQSRPIDLSAEVRGIRALLLTAVRGRARLELDLQDDLPAIHADGPQIQQVLMNLAINAAESSEREVEVRIRTRRVELKEDALPFLVPGSQLGAGHHVALEVEDDGCGLDEATQQRIFDPFFTTKTSGRGLGLASTLGIVHQHGGGIHVRSKLGSGTRFRLLFPVLALEQYADSSVELRPENPREAGLVLVVDDDVHVLRVVQRMLESYDYSVIVAASGEEGIEVYRQRHAEINLVLLDLIMSGMDGERTFAALREICPDARVLLASGHDAPGVTRRLAADGLAGVVRKPYTPNELAAAVARVIGTRSSQDPSAKSGASFDALRAAYEAELPGLLSELSASVGACRVAGADEQRFREAWRMAHKLKGTAGSYGLGEIAEALEGIERVLSAMCAGTAAGKFDWAMIEKALARASATLSHTARRP